MSEWREKRESQAVAGSTRSPRTVQKRGCATTETVQDLLSPNESEKEGTRDWTAKSKEAQAEKSEKAENAERRKDEG